MKLTHYNSAREKISHDTEIMELRALFSNVEDKRAKNASHKLSDILMTGFAIFALKYPSIRDFEQQSVVEKKNFETVYGIEKTCSDTQLREVLDEINPDFLRQLFPKKFNVLEKTGILKEFGYKIGSSSYLIVSCDGVQHFSSKKVNCACCLTKTHRNGTTTYHHNMLCAALVHPDKREVFIMDVEPIIRQDGNVKNDCERNAAKRLQANLRINYEKYENSYHFLFVEDALYANVPHIEQLEGNAYSYILNVKPDSHKSLFAAIQEQRVSKLLRTYSYTENGVKHEFEYANNIVLCHSSPTTLVNFVSYTQTDKKGKKTTFTWITNIKLTENKLVAIMRAGRARWKIENETFNTLKNLGYHFEHNYGHGKDLLSTMFAYLMLFAFYTDQLIQSCCHIFKEIEKNVTTKIKIWSTIRAIFQTTLVQSIQEVYEQIALLYNFKLKPIFLKI